MKSRPPSRRRRHDQRLRAVQRLRLEGIARGQIDPSNLREECFAAMLTAGGGFSTRDFILSPILFLIEANSPEAEPFAAV